MYFGEGRRSRVYYFAATPGPTSKAFVDALWNTPTPYGEQRYYDGMLYLMSLMHLSGNFKIWGPK